MHEAVSQPSQEGDWAVDPTIKVISVVAKGEETEKARKKARKGRM